MVVPVGHVDQVKIQIVRSQVLQSFLKGAQGLIVSRVLNPDLGGEEQFLPCNSALPDGLANRPLVAVAGRRVNEPVSGLQSGQNALLTNRLISHLKNTQPLLGHLNAIVQLNGIHCVLLLSCYSACVMSVPKYFSDSSDSAPDCPSD